MKNRYIATALLLFIFIASNLYAAVDMRIRKVSHVRVPAGTNTLVVDIEARASYDYSIYRFQGAFYLGDVLRDLSPTISYTDTTVQYFTDADYHWHDGTSNGIIRFKQILDGAGTPKVMAKNTWHQIVRYTIQYPYSTPEYYTTLEWSDEDEDYLFTVEVLITGIPISVTGGRAAVPTDLQDISLPVQMGEFAGTYEYENGVVLDWDTHREIRCSGFYILRSDNENGPYERVSDQLIPGSGTTNILHNYSFVDQDVEWDSRYYYMIHEISQSYDDTSKTYYGPIQVQTEAAPTKFSLYQNYPNPFNPETQIKYEMTEESYVELIVYNIIGKKIKTLVDARKPAGIYWETWDGTNEYGELMPSGIYLCKLVTANRVEVIKMTKIH